MSEERLIEAVRAHKELYDTQSADYMKIKLKNRIWKDISKEVNLKDGDEAKALWLKLRGSYRDARRRQARSMKRGAAPETIKPWRFQKQMSFLEQFMSTGPREGNLCNDTDDDLELQDRKEFEEESCQNERHDISEDNIVEDNTDSNAEFTAMHLQHSSGSKRRKLDMQSLFKRSLEQREERARQRAEERKRLQSKDDLKNDPLYNFFNSMYQSTKKMPPKYQHKVRSKLFEAVSQAEEEILDISSRPVSTFSSSSNYEGSCPSPQTWTGNLE